MEFISGIYAVTHNATGKTYVGASRNIPRREYEHFRDLHLGKHHCKAMQSDFNDSASGNSAVSFRVVQYCPESELVEREQFHIDAIEPIYNNNKAGGGCYKVTDAMRRERSERMKGKQIRSVGTFETPWGSFPSSLKAAEASNGLMSQGMVWNACRKPETVITRLAYAKSAYLKKHFTKDVIGTCWSSLNFGFIAN